MNNQIKIGEYYKHFKGETLVEKNIYEILQTNVIYTGEHMTETKDLVIYKNIFDNKIFAREASDLLTEIEPEKQEKYHQKTRIQKLTPEEIALIKTPEYIAEKQTYLQNK